MSAELKCGYIALIGRANAGKSTLLNSCIGAKIAGVSRTPQTTRNNIVGVETWQNHTQFLFLDTPGIHSHKKKVKLNQLMNREAWSSLQDADVICYLVDGTKGMTNEDKKYLTQVANLQLDKKIILLLSKCDLLKNKVLEQLKQDIKKELIELGVDAPVFPVSAKNKIKVAELKEYLTEFIPVAPWLFEEDDLTNKNESFVVAELIREQIYRQLNQEIPFGTTVIVEKMRTNDKNKVVYASIIVSSASHKPIILGKGGEKIKSIGIKSRESIAQFFDYPVYLDLHLKVQTDWVNNLSLIEKYQGLELS